MFTNPLTPINRPPWDHPGAYVHLLRNSRVSRPSQPVTQAFALFVRTNFHYLHTFPFHVWGQSLQTWTPNTLNTRSQLFMTILMGKSCSALVAQAFPSCCFVSVLSLSPFQLELFWGRHLYDKMIVLALSVVGTSFCFCFRFQNFENFIYLVTMI
jgi:hypothetical protein